MAKSPLRLKPHLFILIHGGSGVPYAMRLNVARLSLVVFSLGAAFFCTLVGTLFFFRELEMNRKLTERVLEFETKEFLANLSIAPVKPLAEAAVPSAVAPAPKAPVAQSTLDRTTTALTLATPTPPQTAAAAALESVTPSTVQARIGELGAECFEEDCEIRLSMVPTRTGVAQGELLVILETEIPRIGAGNPTTQIRKRFFIYPGSQTRDDLPQESLNEITRKPFRFTRGLQTTTNFTIGKLLRPLAVNVYLFDKDRTLIHHERKAIEREE